MANEQDGITRRASLEALVVRDGEVAVAIASIATATGMKPDAILEELANDPQAYQGFIDERMMETLARILR